MNDLQLLDAGGMHVRLGTDSAVASADRMPQLGWWYAECCPEDLYPVDEEVIADIRERIDDEEVFGVMVWPTLEEALAHPFMAQQIAEGRVSPKALARLGLG